MTGIELAILVCGIAALVFLSTALCVLSSRLDDLQCLLDHDANRASALANRVQALEDLLAKLVGDRVDETLTQGCRDLNEVGRS
jgi:hypothetical protein